jgi:predicted amidohydrolase YtcJ
MDMGDDRAQERADLIVHNAKVTTLQDRGNATVDAVAVRGEKIAAVGGEAEVMRLAGPSTTVVDAGGRRVIPGLNDSHLHAIRGGLMFNLELRWDGVDSLARGLEMIHEQAERTPEGQWVRVMGGWSPYQFTEKRMPTVAELNRVAPDVPVLVLFGYSQVLLNRAGTAALRLSPASEQPGGQYEYIDGGLTVRGNTAVYATIGGLPALADIGDRLNSTQYFLRELNRSASPARSMPAKARRPTQGTTRRSLSSRPGQASRSASPTSCSRRSRGPNCRSGTTRPPLAAAA